MKTVKVAKLTGTALDWAVAKCDGHNVFIKHAPLQVMYTPKGKRSWYIYTPSTNWVQGGPIIERDCITVSQGSPVKGLEWMACDRGSTHIQHGPTYLTSAMRCYVAGKMGGTVEVPEELL